MIISIADDFTKSPGARTKEDGPFSGEEFYEKLLKSKFEEILKTEEKLEVILDGTDGFASSFLNESFRRLAQHFGKELVKSKIIITSNEISRYKEIAMEAINDTKN